LAVIGRIGDMLGNIKELLSSNYLWAVILKVVALLLQGVGKI